MGKKYLDAFQCLTEIPTGAIRTYPVTSGVAIDKGDAIIITSGYAALATALSTATFAGIALDTNTAAEASADGAVDVQVIQPLPSLQFRVPVTATDLITLAQVGLAYELQDEKSIDENDAATAYWGFFVDSIDVSTEAVAINTYGYAIGHFVSLATS